MLIDIVVATLIVVLVLFLVKLLPFERRTKQLVGAIVVILGVLYLLSYAAI